MRPRKSFVTVAICLVFGFIAAISLAQESPEKSGSSARYTLTEDHKAVIDNKTGLIWQQTDDGKMRDLLEGAHSYCDELTLGGHDDWRLPRIDELRTIIDYSRWPGAIDPVFNCRMDSYWSGSAYYEPPWHGKVWGVGFIYGLAGPWGGGVRCVRGGPYWSFDPSDRLVVQGENSAKDSLTGLVWQRSSDGEKRNWWDAIKYCDNLTIDGESDWRLPSMAELQTIVDYTEHHPSISKEVFYGLALSGLYWSSSPCNYGYRNVWLIAFNDGRSGWRMRSTHHVVRCVRGEPW
jgi:hypothetical protein